MLPTKLAFVDVETTGFRPTVDRIIEIGILRVEDGKPVSTFSSLIKPQSYLPDEITRLTGITNDALDTAPLFTDVKYNIAELLEGCFFVAHNARFDYGFVRNEFSREGMLYTSKQICTAKLTKKLVPHLERYNLDAIIGAFNLSCENRHRAFDDAKVLWDLYQKLLREFNESQLVDALATITKKPTLPLHISQDQIKLLPQSPGVYIFYGEGDIPLYVGKSVNIKNRVLSHFSSDRTNTKEMKLSQQVRYIKTQITYGELGALLQEASLIKTLQPVYNRSLRLYRSLVCVLQTETTTGYFTTSIMRTNTFTSLLLSGLLGIFKSERKAKNFIEKKAQEYKLCKKLLGVEHTATSCFGYRLDVCNGACVGNEKKLRYNARFMQAFKKKIKLWPFSGPIMVSEEDTIKHEGEAHVFDQWCYLGSVPLSVVSQFRHPAQRDVVMHNGISQDAIPFDIDAYKILISYIMNPKNQQAIKPITDVYAQELLENL